MWHGSENRPTMNSANMDIKTAFDVARDQDVHGWITAAILHEVAGLKGQATFEDVPGTFSVNEMHPSRER